MARSNNCFVNCFSRPFSPMMSSGFHSATNRLRLGAGEETIDNELIDNLLKDYKRPFTQNFLHPPAASFAVNHIQTEHAEIEAAWG
jgi:hypothetical protein